MKLLMKTFLFLSIYLACNLQSSLQAQNITVAGRVPMFRVIYDDTLAGAVTKVLLPSVGHKGWFRIDQSQFFSGWVTFDLTGLTGLTSVDTVEILMEQYSDGAGSTENVPTSASTCFFEAEAPGTIPARESLALYDSTNITDNLRTFFSFHGTGDPEIALGTWVRFYTRVVGGFTGSGLGFKFAIKQQP